METKNHIPWDCAPQIREIYQYWNRIRGNRNCPSRRDFEPSDIPELLAHISLVDVSPTPPRFVYRLVGTAVVGLLGKELTGKEVGTGVKPSEYDRVIGRYNAVVEQRQPLYHRDFLQEENNDYTIVERVMLPLSDDGETVNMILVLVQARQKS